MPKSKTNALPSKKSIEKVFQILEELYPNHDTELTYDGPFQLLMAVILSAQCTDEQVNKTTPTLFAKYPDAQSMSEAKLKDIEKLIHSCGFYRQKAKSLVSASKDLVEQYQGEVPGDLDKLVKLRGVGRKTASVVLNQAFDIPAIAVDTHVKRVSNRLGWTRNSDPVKIEFDLRELLPEKWWASVNGTLILHGRRICSARKPKCDICELRRQCKNPVI